MKTPDAVLHKDGLDGQANSSHLLKTVSSLGTGGMGKYRPESFKQLTLCTGSMQSDAARWDWGSVQHRTDITL